MEKAQVKLSPYNQIAIKAFLGTLITILPLPEFVYMYKCRQWKTAYNVLTLDHMKDYADMVIKTYNLSYEITLMKNN